MNRRQFSQWMAGQGVLFSLWACSPKVNPVKKNRQNPLIYPKPLKQGDTVGLIAPASGASEEKIDQAIQNLTSLGLVVKEGKYLRERNGFLAGQDQERIQDIHEMFADPTVQGIWCVRGGYGATRLLPNLDYDVIKQHPKIFIGYSDITAFLLAIYKNTKLITFHGPVASSEFSPYVVSNIQQTLFKSLSNTSLFPVNEALTPEVNYRCLRHGKALGPIVGGNLTLLASMCGGPYLPDFEDKIVFLEDIGEKPYRIDRMLVQLRQSTNIERAAAVIFGQFTDCEGPEDSQTIDSVIGDFTARLSCPVGYGHSIGHVVNQCILPIGLVVSFNADDGVITF